MIQALQSDGSKNIPKRVINVEEGTLEEDKHNKSPSLH